MSQLLRKKSLHHSRQPNVIVCSNCRRSCRPTKLAVLFFVAIAFGIANLLWSSPAKKYAVHLYGAIPGDSAVFPFDSTSQETKKNNKSSNDESRKSNIFPKRLVSVFGLEKSGTTWTFHTICKAFGIPVNKDLSFRCTSEDGSLVVQHISQPWGFFPGGKVNQACASKNIEKTERDLFAVVPSECLNHFIIGKAVKKKPDECKEEAGLNEIVKVAPRFFVNITSHVNWYLDHGVDTTAVILMRDNNIVHISKTNEICQNDTAAREENDHANEITRHAIQSLPPNRAILVSFEGLVSLQMPYLKEHVYKPLGIIGDDDAVYVPKFKDANKKYINTDLLQF